MGNTHALIQYTHTTMLYNIMHALLQTLHNQPSAESAHMHNEGYSTWSVHVCSSSVYTYKSPKNSTMTLSATVAHVIILM